MSSRMIQRRAEARARATLLAIEAHGLTASEYYAAIGAAWLAWSARWPWRFLPHRLRGWTFDVFGGRTAGRFVANWKTDEQDLHALTPDAGE